MKLRDEAVLPTQNSWDSMISVGLSVGLGLGLHALKSSLAQGNLLGAHTVHLLPASASEASWPLLLKAEPVPLLITDSASAPISFEATPMASIPQGGALLSGLITVACFLGQAWWSQFNPLAAP